MYEKALPNIFCFFLIRISLLVVQEAKAKWVFFALDTHGIFRKKVGLNLTFCGPSTMENIRRYVVCSAYQARKNIYKFLWLGGSDRIVCVIPAWPWTFFVWT